MAFCQDSTGLSILLIREALLGLRPGLGLGFSLAFPSSSAISNKQAKLRKPPLIIPSSPSPPAIAPD